MRGSHVRDAQFVRALRGGLFFAYLFALVMSTAHLKEWYALTLGNLPPWIALGLALSLELSAFLLSIASHAFSPPLPMARISAPLALLLVWVGNYLAMARSGPDLPPWEPLLQSAFVPISTLAVGKVIGELYRYEGTLLSNMSEAAGTFSPAAIPVPPMGQREALPVRPQDVEEVEERRMGALLGFVRVFPGGVSEEQLRSYLPYTPEEIRQSLEVLQAKGAVRQEGNLWVLHKGRPNGAPVS